MGYTNFQNNVTACNDSNLNQMQIGLMQLVFPIGSTYITQTDINPSTILNFGTWERLKGKVLVGLNEDDTDFDTIGKTGGEKTHKLTVDEMPEHSHSQSLEGNDNNPEGDGAAYKWINSSKRYLYNGSDLAIKTGGSQPHNNLQPYEVIGYMWIRRA